MQTENEDGWSYSSYRRKEIAIAICETEREAIEKGNEALEVFEKHFDLNTSWNQKERFDSKKHLVSDSCYLQTPFSFFATVEALDFADLEKTLLKLKEISV